MGLTLIKAKENGFSLMELVIVILIISVSIIYMIPKIESDTKLNLNKSARNLAGTIIYVRNEAIFKNKKLRIMYDIEGQSYHIKEIVQTSLGFMQEEYEETELNALTLEEGVSFMDVSTLNNGKQNFGKVYTHFSLTGMVEKTIIHLKNDNENIKTLDVNVLTGEVDIHDGYYE